MSRPEDTLPPSLFYSPTTAAKYHTSSRLTHIQTLMTHRALTLLALPYPSLILDIGCGTGLSGSILSSSSSPASLLTSPTSSSSSSSPSSLDVGSGSGPHTWIGMDISASMLAVAIERDVDGDLLLADMGQGIPFRAGTFDAAISISAIQWLCNEDVSADTGLPGEGGGGEGDGGNGKNGHAHTAKARLARFFTGLYASLRRGGRAVCQFYPRNEAQRSMICGAAVRAGFGAGVLEDDPGTKNSKLYLVLTVGGNGNGGGGDGEGERDSGGWGKGGNGAGDDITAVVKGMEGVEVVDPRRRRERERERDGGIGKGNGKGKRGGGEGVLRKGSKAWIMKKKEQMEGKGKVVKTSSKYTGRRRGPTF